MKLLVYLAALVVKITLTSLTQAKENGDCDLVCAVNEIRPVCGSDGNTYQSKCVLRLKKCTTGKKLYVDYYGACRAPPSCAEERKRVFKSIREGDLLRLGLFIPECDPDGSYSEVQCSQNKRLCWCVDKHGVEVDDTRVQLKRPDCRSRRSNPYPSNEKYARLLKGCSKDNRVSFNKKVMASFKKEMAKSAGKKAKLNARGIAQWKMSELDADNNNYLDHKEARALIKRMKKVYSPRKCGKTFFFNCDKDQDSYISKNEWLACLGIHESQDTPQCFSQRTRAKSAQAKDPGTTIFIPICNKDGTYKTVQCEKVSKYCWCVHPTTGRNIPNTSVQNAKPDCSKPSRRVKTPTISPAGQSARKQPAKKTPSHSKPDKHSTRTVNEKKVKECDDASWQRFREELVKMIRNELNTLTQAKLGGNSTRRSNPPNIFWALSTRLSDAMVTAWKFVQLDVNRNRLLRDVELFSPQMRKVFGQIRRGRKCSKKLAKSCDVDQNGGLSLEEWRNCLSGRTQKGFHGR